MATWAFMCCGVIFTAEPPVPSPDRSRVLSAATKTTPKIPCSWTLYLGDRGGEGSGTTMGPRGGNATCVPAHLSRKIRGQGPVAPRGTPSSKRSYCRALKRADRLGWSFYRGQLMVGNTDTSPPCPRPAPLIAPTPRCRPRAHIAGYRAPDGRRIAHGALQVASSEWEPKWRSTWSCRPPDSRFKQILQLQ